VKKTFLAFICCLFVLLCSCSLINPENTVEDISMSTEEFAFPEEYMPDSIKLNPSEAYCDDGHSYYKCSYRRVYYSLPFSPPDSGLTWDEVNEYMNSVSRALDGNEPEEMIVVTFIKHFKMPKGQFVELIKKEIRYSASAGIDLLLEQNELPNPDIIYTFDNEIINAYYRRENPVTPDWDKVVVYESYGDYLAAEG